MKEEISTKEKIIQSAFSLLKDNNYAKMSLSQIAKSVGISKTAIYRHFENKEALEHALQSRVYSKVLSLVEQYRPAFYEKKYFQCIEAAVDFIKENPEYLLYSLFSTPNVGEDSQLYEFRKEKLKLFDDVFDADFNIKNYNLYVSGIFISATLIDFMLSYLNVCKCDSVPSADFESYKNQILLLIDKGLIFTKSRNFDDEYYEQIDRFCENSLYVLEPLDKKLVALSNVIYKVGFPNVTVESVANELGMAKSSLYSWFCNKAEMIFSLISAEMNQMMTVILNNVSDFDTLEEKLYVILKTELLYFYKRKETLTVCKWMQLSSEFRNENYTELISEDIAMKFKSSIFPENQAVCEIKKNFPDFNYQMIVGWVFSLPVFLVLNAQVHNFSETEITAALRKIYLMIVEGMNLKNNNKGDNL